MTTLAHLSERLAHLDGVGVRNFDAPALSMVERLLSRAEDAPDGAAARLRERAEQRLVELEQRFIEARDRAASQLDVLVAEGGDTDGRLTRAFESGDTCAVAIAAARHKSRDAHPGRVRAARVRERLVRAAESRKLATARPRRKGATGATLAKKSEVELLELSELLYRRRYDAATARQTVVRELGRLPNDAGVYHVESIAARALARLEQLSPSYLRSRLAHAYALDALSSFVAATPVVSAELQPVSRDEPTP
jgi:hypothetical protein